ncbi:protein kinase [Embleya sp. NPDC050154]|uniref:serine/threonine-protein kinase n=1 Tax=Embleya sp. NPDC050154 TaxID=3363988 RepID=UPI0037B428FC
MLSRKVLAPTDGPQTASKLQGGDPSGAGANGDVWRAFDTVRGVAAALKIPRLKKLKGAQRKQAHAAFRQEAGIARSLDQPNLVGAYDHSDKRRRPYLAMEVASGDTVEELVRRGGVFSADWAVRVASEAASGLEAMHKAGYLHRDLTTANIIVARSGSAKILDFGLAASVRRDVPDRAPTHRNLRSSAPELLWRTATDIPDRGTPQSDLYSLGVVMYEMLAGRSPFTDKSLQTWEQRLATPVVPLEQVVPDLPAGLHRLVGRLMAFDAGARPASAAEVRTELARLMPGAVAHTRGFGSAAAVDDGPRIEPAAAAQRVGEAGLGAGFLPAARVQSQISERNPTQPDLRPGASAELSSPTGPEPAHRPRGASRTNQPGPTPRGPDGLGKS